MEHWANRETNPTERSKVNERFRFSRTYNFNISFHVFQFQYWWNLSNMNLLRKKKNYWNFFERLKYKKF